MKTLHIYAQEVWHDEVYIAGTRDALHALRDAIDSALNHNAPTVAEAFCSDGEAYLIHVVPASNEQADAMPVPYTDECARAQKDRFQSGPWALMRSNVQIDGGAASRASQSNAELGGIHRNGK